MYYCCSTDGRTGGEDCRVAQGTHVSVEFELHKASILLGITWMGGVVCFYGLKAINTSNYLTVSD